MPIAFASFKTPFLAEPGLQAGTATRFEPGDGFDLCYGQLAASVLLDAKEWDHPLE